MFGRAEEIRCDFEPWLGKAFVGRILWRTHRWPRRPTFRGYLRERYKNAN